MARVRKVAKDERSGEAWEAGMDRVGSSSGRWASSGMV